MFSGGDVLEARFNHPTLGQGIINCKSGEDSTFNRGGIRSNDDAQGITGSGEMIDQLNNTRWSVEITAAWDMNTRDELDKVDSLAESPIPADWIFTMVTGATFGGSGKPVGDLEGNGNAATFTLKIAGGGKLKKIA